MTERTEYTVVTPEQLQQGYRILGASGAIWRAEFVVARRLADGNFLVRTPGPVRHDEFHHTPRCNTGGCHD